MDLVKKIDNRSAKVGVIGLGYVGLPLIIEFVKKGFAVTGFDIDRNKVDFLKAGKIPALEGGLGEGSPRASFARKQAENGLCGPDVTRKDHGILSSRWYSDFMVTHSILAGRMINSPDQ